MATKEFELSRKQFRKIEDLLDEDRVTGQIHLETTNLGDGRTVLVKYVHFNRGKSVLKECLVNDKGETAEWKF